MFWHDGVIVQTKTRHNILVLVQRPQNKCQITSYKIVDLFGTV